jgi:hypothetical protein
MPRATLAYAYDERRTTHGISTSGTINLSALSTISRSLTQNSGQKERITIQDDALSYAERRIYDNADVYCRAQMTCQEAERANSAVRSRGSCGLSIVTIIKPSARLYIRTEETLIISTNQNLPGRPDKEMRLGVRWQKQQSKSEKRKERREGATSANWSKNFGDFAVFSGPPKRIQFYVRYEAL